MKKFFVWILVLIVVGIGGYFLVSEKLVVKSEEGNIFVVSEKLVDWENLSQNVVSIVAEKKISYLLEGEDIRPRALHNVSSKVVAGTAFLLAYNDGAVFLTCKHVVSDRDLKYFVDIQGQKFLIDNVWYHDDLDLALLKVDSIDFSSGFNEPFVWFQGDTLLGDELRIIGNLFGKYNSSITAGVLSKKDVSLSAEGKEYSGLYMVDALLSHGNSGSPVFNNFGELVAIVVAQNTDGLGFVLPISEQKIKEFYESVFVH